MLSTVQKFGLLLGLSLASAASLPPLVKSAIQQRDNVHHATYIDAFTINRNQSNDTSIPGYDRSGPNMQWVTKYYIAFHQDASSTPTVVPAKQSINCSLTQYEPLQASDPAPNHLAIPCNYADDKVANGTLQFWLINPRPLFPEVNHKQPPNTNRNIQLDFSPKIGENYHLTVNNAFISPPPQYVLLDFTCTNKDPAYLDCKLARRSPRMAEN